MAKDKPLRIQIKIGKKKVKLDIPVIDLDAFLEQLATEIGCDPVEVLFAYSLTCTTKKVNTEITDQGSFEQAMSVADSKTNITVTSKTEEESKEEEVPDKKSKKDKGKKEKKEKAPKEKKEKAPKENSKKVKPLSIAVKLSETGKKVKLSVPSTDLEDFLACLSMSIECEQDALLSEYSIAVKDKKSSVDITDQASYDEALVALKKKGLCTVTKRSEEEVKEEEVPEDDIESAEEDMAEAHAAPTFGLFREEMQLDEERPKFQRQATSNLLEEALTAGEDDEVDIPFVLNGIDAMTNEQIKDMINETSSRRGQLILFSKS